MVRRFGRQPWAPGARRPIWTDRWAVALALLALALDGGLGIALWRRYELLPELVAIHFNAFGEVDLIGGKQDIFKLPLIGALVWAANGLVATVSSPYDRVIARIAVGTAALVELLICLAVWRILT